MDQVSVSRNKLYRFAFSVIAVIVLLSMLTAGFIVSVANDLYAFIKADATMTLEISSPVSLSELAKKMQAGGIIENPNIFSLYIRSHGKAAALESFCGSVKLDSHMSYREILREFLK